MSDRFSRWFRDAKKIGHSKKGINFQLYWEDDRDFELIETVANLMDNRQFSNVVRIALEVIPALMNGNPEPLYRHFPWLVEGTRNSSRIIRTTEFDMEVEILDVKSDENVSENFLDSVKLFM